MNWVIMLALIPSLTLFVGGCNRVALGGGIRQVRANVAGKNVPILLPLSEVRFENDNVLPSVDVYTRLQFAQLLAQTGTTDVDKPFGSAQSLGFGARWYPFEDNPKVGRRIGVDVVGEVFHANYEIHGLFKGIVKYKIKDELWGYGITPGFTGEIPINWPGHWHLSWHAGWSLLEVCDSEFDIKGGLSASVTLQTAIK